MRVRILIALSVVVLLSAGVATGAAAPKQQYPASQQLCVSSHGGTFSTKANSSFYTPQYKKQGVLWACNSFTGGATASQALGGSCHGDGGQAASTNAPGFVTCWKNP